jgi:hypothetical protein
MKLSKGNLILIAVLVFQVALTAVMFLPRSTAANEQPGGPLIADLNADAVTTLTIRDNNKAEIVVSKDASGTWVLPNADNFPVASSQVTTLISKIQNLNSNRLIAQNASNHNRLHVSDSTYERLIEIKQGDKVDKLYVGTSAGTNATHTRANSQDKVYLNSDLAAFDIPMTLSSWVNTSYFNATQDTITTFQIQNAEGVFNFKKVDSAWILDGLKSNEILNNDKVTQLLNQIASVSLMEPVSKTAPANFVMDKPTATITLATHQQITVQPTAEPTSVLQLPKPAATPGAPITQSVDESYTLTVGAKLDNGNYGFKASSAPYYVQIAASVAEMFSNLKRADLVTVAPSNIEEF